MQFPSLGESIQLETVVSDPLVSIFKGEINAHTNAFLIMEIIIGQIKAC